MAASPNVWVVGPVCDQARRLGVLIALLRAQDCTGSVELIFVDGEATDASLRVLQIAATEGICDSDCA